MNAPIVQFGTSRFLQAHVDLMLSEAISDGQAVGRVTVVETTGSPASRRRIAAFAEGAPFPVRIRGLSNGAPVDEQRMVNSVCDGLSARDDHERLCTVFRAASAIVSNTADAGYAVPPRPQVTANGWTTFPELLTVLLHERFIHGAKPLTLLPCELVPQNGSVLKAIILGLSGTAGFGADFADWLSTRCIWCNTLVDRIVSEPLEPVGAVAEPYALWAIEAQAGFTPPCRHPDLVIVDDILPFERRKLFILNLAHTLLAARWMAEGSRPGALVREAIADPEWRAWLGAIIEDEVLPAFADAGIAARYWQSCLERFANPFLDHRLADIAQNHAAKIERRGAAFVAWATGSDGSGTMRFPRLHAALDLDRRPV